MGNIKNKKGLLGSLAEKRELARAHFLDRKKIKSLREKQEHYFKKIETLDDKIIAVQQSSRTLFPQFLSLHNGLRMRWGWYYRWHLRNRVSTVHWLLLVLYIVSLFGVGFVFVKPKAISAQINIDEQSKYSGESTLVAQDESGVLQEKPNESEIVEERTENFKKFKVDGKEEYRVSGSAEPIHYRDDPFSESEQFKEIDLTIEEAQGTGWDYQMDRNGYKTRFWNSKNNSGVFNDYVARYYRDGKWLEMAPAELIYKNDLGEKQIISKPISGISPEINNEKNYISWNGAFGEGIDFRYNVSPTKFFKTVVIDKKERLPEPEISKEGLKLVVSMSFAWVDEVDPENGFASSEKVEQVDTMAIDEAVSETPESSAQQSPELEVDNEEIVAGDVVQEDETKIDEKIDNVGELTYKDDQDRDIWSLAVPLAWDSGDEKKTVELEQDILLVGDNAFAEVGLGYSKIENGFSYPLFVDMAITEEVVGASSDDANDGSVNGTTGYLNYSTSVTGSYKWGFRFTGVPIPQGVTLTSATISPYFYSTSYDDPQMTIYGDDIDTSTTFNITDNQPSDKTKTTASATWQAVGVGAGYQASADISSVATEIVGRAGWASGNDLSILTVAISSSYFSRIFTYDYSTSRPAKFNASYAYTGNVTISGNVYTAENKSTNIGEDKTVGLSVNGAAATTVETTSGGAFSFSNVAITDNQPVALFVDGETEKGSLISNLPAGNFTGIEMFTDKVVLQTEQAANITNSTLNSAAACGDTDIGYSVSSGNIDFSDDLEVYLIANETYVPGGTVELDSFEALAGATFNPDSNAVTVHGSWVVDSAGAFTSSGTVTFDNSSGTETLSTGGYNTSHDFQNLTKSGAGILQLTGSNTLEIAGTLSISSGSTLDLNGKGLYSIPGTYSNAGTFKLQGGESCGGINANLNTGTVEYYGTGTYTPNCFVSSYNYPYANMKITGSGSFTFGTTSLTSYLNASTGIEITNGTVTGGIRTWGYNQSGGSMTIKNDSLIYGDFIISAGSWSSSTYDLTIDALDRDLELTAPGISFANMVFLMDSSSAADRVISIGSGSISFANLQLDASGGKNLTLDASLGDPNITISNSLTFTSGGGAEYLSLGDGTWDVSTPGSGILIPSGAILSAGSSTFIARQINSNASYYFAPSGNHFYNMQVASAGVMRFYGSAYVDNDFTVNAASTSDSTADLTFYAMNLYVTGNIDFVGVGSGTEILTLGASSTISVAGNADFSDGTFTATTGSVVNFNKSSGTQTLNTGGTDTSHDFSNITKSDGGELQISGNGLDFDDTLTIDSGCTVYINGQNVSGDTNTIVNNGTFKLNGDETVSITTWDSDTGTTEYAATSGSRAIKDYTYYNLKISGDGGTFSLPAAKTVNDLTITAGIFDLGGYNLTVSNTFSNDSTLRMTGDETVSLTNDVNSGQIEYNGASGTRSIKTWTYFNLKINSTSGTYNLPASTDANGTVTVTTGTFALNGYDLIVGLNWSNSATFTPGTNKVTFDGTDTQTITAGGTGAGKTFYDVQITNASVAGTVFADSCTLTGTFTATTASSKLTFNAGSTYAFANISLNGQATGTKIILRSSSTNSQWFFNVSQASPTATYVDVQDSDATGGNAITPTSSKNSGNNENWLFKASIFGTIYAAEDKLTNIGANKTVGYSINGGTKATVETSTGGTFSLLNITIAANNTLTIFVDDETEEGGLVTQVASAENDVTDLELYTSKFVLRHETAGPINNTLLATADDCADDDIKYAISSGNADFTDGFELWVDSGETYTPGGTLECDDFDINGTFNLEANNATIHGSWDASGGTVSTSGTIIFDATDSGNTIIDGGNSWGSVTFNGSGGGWSFSDSTILAGDLTVTLGTLSGTTDITVGGGDASGNGTINLTGGTFIIDGTGNFAGDTGWTFYNLNFGDGSGTTTTTKTGTSIITTTNILTIAANQTLDAGDDTWIISGTSGTPFVDSGTFSESNSIFKYTGNNSNGNTNIVATTYHDLYIDNASETFDAVGNTTVTGILTINAGTFDAKDKTITLTGSGTSFIKTGTLTASTSTFKYEVSENTEVTAADYYNLELIDPPSKNLFSSESINDNAAYALSNTPTVHKINKYLGLEASADSGAILHGINQSDNSEVLKAQTGEVELADKRTRNFKTFDLGNGEYRVGGDIGPIHYKNNPFDTNESFKEINLEIYRTPLADYDYAMEQNGYKAFFWNDKKVDRDYEDLSQNLDSDSNQILQYVAKFQRAGHYLEMAPVALEWENDRGDTQLISLPSNEAAEPIIDNNNHTLTWSNVFGAGIDFSYNISPERFFKTVIVRDKNALPAANIDSTGLKLNVVMSFAWDEGAIIAGEFGENQKITLDNRLFDDAQEVLDHPENYISTDEFQRSLWSMKTPQAWDSKGQSSNIAMDWNLTRKGSSVMASISAPAEFVLSEKTVFPIYIDATMSEEQTAASSDDALSYGGTFPGTGTLNTTTTSHPIGYDGMSGSYYLFGARFTPPLPDDATITTATLSICSNTTISADTTWKIAGESTGNAATFSSGHTPYSAYQSKTASNVIWSIGTSTWTAGEWYTSPDISTPVQAVVDNASWTSSNGMVLIVYDSGGNYRYARTYDYSGNVSGPKFNATYTTPKTMTLSAGTFNIAGNLTIGDGTNTSIVNATTNDPVVNVDGNMEIKANATFVASNSASFSVAANFTNNASGTFTHSSGVLTLDGTGTQSITTGGDSLNSVSVTNTGGEVSQADAMTIAGTLTINSSATYDINGQNITLATLANSGTFRLQGGEATVTITTKDTDSGTIEYDGTGTYTSLLYGATYWNLKINGSGSFTIGAATTVNAVLTLAGGTFSTSSSNYALNIGTSTTTDGAYSQTGGVFQGNASAIACYGNYSVTSGTYTAGTSTLTLDTTPQNLTLTGNGYSFYNLIFRSNSSASARTATLGSGTITATGYFYVNAANTQSMTVDASVNNPNIAITGALDYSGTGSGSEAISMGSGTWTVSGNIIFVDGTINAGASTLEMAGASNSTIYGNNQTLNNLTISRTKNIPYVASGSSNFYVAGVLNVADGYRLEFNLDVRVTFLKGASLNLNSTGYLYRGSSSSIVLEDATAATLCDSGSIGVDTYFEPKTQDVVIKGRDYGMVTSIYTGSLYIRNTTSTNFTATLGNTNSQTIRTNSFRIFANGTGNMTVDGSVYNPDVTTAKNNSYTYNFDFAGTGGGSETLKAGSGTWSVGASTINFTGGTFDSGTSSFIFNRTTGGSYNPAITCNSQSFNNMTVVYGSAGFTFNDSCTVTGTFTDITASSKIVFKSLATFAFANISINGQASGTKITITSSDTTNANLALRQFYFNVSQLSPQASYVTVTNSDALGGNAITPINSVDGGNNENWIFNSAPTNDSLTFTNPYSSNIAVSDDTTEWNFRVLATDVDGSTNFNYVELRFANNSDSTQPYDSLKFRWTESTDAFSEEADTQSAAAITSTSANSSVSGNQWTLDFKIKFDSDFLTKDTSYAAELYSLDDAAASDTDNYANKYQITALSLTLGVDSATLDFGNLLPGSVITGSTVATITTNYPNGYSLSISDGVSGSDSALLHTDTTTRVADYAGTIATPTLWSGTGLGICLYDATGKDTSKWGTGTTASDSNNKYAGVPQNSTEIHAKTGSPTSSDDNSVGYKLVVPNTQKTGAYSGNVTFTATGTLI